MILETNYHWTLFRIQVEDRIVKGIKRQSSERNENGIVSLLKHAAGKHLILQKELDFLIEQHPILYGNPKIRR